MTEVSIAPDGAAVNQAEYINPWRLFRGSIIPEWLEVRTDVGPAAKLVYARLMRYAGRCGVAWPTLETLAESMGISRRTVCYALDELRSAGLIETKKVRFGGGSEYRFLSNPWMAHDVRHEDAEDEAANSAEFALLDAQKCKIRTPIVQNLHSNSAESAILEVVVNDASDTSYPQKNGAEENHRRESMKRISNTTTTRTPATDTRGSEAKELLTLAVEACQRYGRPKFPVRGPAAIKALKTIIATYGLEDARWVIEEFYRDPPEWHNERGLLAPEHIVGAAQRLMMRRQKTPTKTKTGAVVTEPQEFVEDSIDVDSEGKERRVRIWRDAEGRELRRRWGKVLVDDPTAGWEWPGRRTR